MKFGSVCSGIEAASVAWHPLGWRAAWLAEIEPFPSAVLAHHYPDVPNIGDMTKLLDLIPSGAVEAPDVFCGGTPCQAFSVAGLRKSLDDARGNLSLTFCEIANAIDTVRTGRGDKPAIIFWENVPGVLSTKDNAFGCFLAGLAGEDDPLEPPGGKWTNAGAVHGPARTVAWRVLDAQYFGVAQRRRRVFVVASARNDFDPAAVLFEFDGVRRDSAPSREAGQTVTPTIRAGSPNGGAGHGARSGDSKDELIAPVSPTLRAGGNRTGGDCPPGTDVDTADSLIPVTTHTLRGEGFDASEDGTGRGTPLVPVHCRDVAQTITSNYGKQVDNSDTALGPNIVAFDTTQVTSAANYSNPQPGDPCHPLAAGAHAPAIAFPANLSGTQCASAENLSPSLGALNPTAVAVALRGREGGATAELGDEVQNCLRASQGGGDNPHVLAPVYTTKLHNTASNNAGKIFEERSTCLDANSPPPALLTAMQVRRLTPVECERLQGFPTVSEKVIIEACLDHQNQSVHVALKCLRWQNSAWPVGVSELMPHAKTAAVPFSTSQANQEPLAALHVRMHSVDELLEIRSAGRLIWSANGAGQSRKSLPPTLTENSVQELARLLRVVARTIMAGKAESPPSIRLSFPASSGAISAEKSGREMEVSASDAMSDQHRATFTTSDLGLITTFSDSTAETLCCFALHAIAGCIPSTTLPETFSIELTVETPYTAIPWRKKPASECSDGPRYKALGNSWAVPNVRWIGQRIQAALMQPANDNGQQASEAAA